MIAIVIGQDDEAREARKSAECHAVPPALPGRPCSVEKAAENLRSLGLGWNYPTVGWKTIQGLTCHAYQTRDLRARISCFLAHHFAWRMAVNFDKPVLVMESDCEWVREWDPEILDHPQFGMVSLNSPLRATRQAVRYHVALQEARTQGLSVCEVPWIDPDLRVPQGLPGHSCYVIHPWFAPELLKKAEQVGAMPNDALACRQWFPGKLGCVTEYFTKVTGRPSLLA